MPTLFSHFFRGENTMYGKFFTSTFTGSMMGAGPHVFAVWGYIIANAVKGYVELNPAFLSAVIGSPRQKIEEAIEYLSAPDPNSRSSGHEGRRIVRQGQFQYFVTNFDQYHKIQNEDDRREYNRIKQAEHRAKKKSNVGCKTENKANKDQSVKQDLRDVKSPVNDNQACQHNTYAEEEEEAEAEEETTKEKEKEKEPEVFDTTLPAQDDFGEHIPSTTEIAPPTGEIIYQAYPRHVGKAQALKAIEKAFKKITPMELLSKVQEYAASPAGKKGEFTPHPSTWMNREQWNDDPAEWHRDDSNVHGNGKNELTPENCGPVIYPALVRVEGKVERRIPLQSGQVHVDFITNPGHYDYSLPKVNAWAVWVDIRRNRYLTDPITDRRDLEIAKTLGESIPTREELEWIYVEYIQDTDGDNRPLRWISNRVSAYRAKIAKCHNPDGTIVSYIYGITPKPDSDAPIDPDVDPADAAIAKLLAEQDAQQAQQQQQPAEPVGATLEA
jgi:hypothetical protein